MENSTITNDLDRDNDDRGVPVYADMGSTIILRRNNSITNNGDDAAFGVFRGSYAREYIASTPPRSTIIGAAIGFDVWLDSSFDSTATVTAPDNYVGFDSTLSMGFGSSVSGNITAYENSKVGVRGPVDGTLKCETYSTINNYDVGDFGSTDCPYAIVTSDANAELNSYVIEKTNYSFQQMVLQQR